MSHRRYDDEGRRVSRTDRVTGVVTTYGYSVLDQLVSLEEGGERWDFTYDARELRVLVRQAVGGSEVYGESFVYDLNGTVRASYDTVRTAAYLAGFGFGEVLARVDSGAEVALRDRLGTTVGWVDGSRVSELVVRDAYGVRGATGIVVPFGYTGHAEDPTGLVWGRARCMAPEKGVWRSSDGILFEPRYLYARGGPAHLVDSNGSFSFGKLAAGACLGGIVTAGAGLFGEQIANRIDSFVYNNANGAVPMIDDLLYGLGDAADVLRESSLEIFGVGLAVAIAGCGASAAIALH